MVKWVVMPATSGPVSSFSSLGPKNLKTLGRPGGNRSHIGLLHYHRRRVPVSVSLVDQAVASAQVTNRLNRALGTRQMNVSWAFLTER
jgi:hypothetical protein